MTSGIHFRRRLRLPGAIVLMAVVAVLAVSGGEASAGPVSCGETITADTTLDADLVNCPNNGILIGADGITLDLNGHTIDGDGTRFVDCARDEPCDGGIYNVGHDGVTVMHGSVRQFEAGVTVADGNNNRLLDISASGNRFHGLGLFGSAGSLVKNSSGTGSTASESSGMVVFGSHDVRIVGNSFRHNAHTGLLTDSNDNLIKGNLFSRNEDEGILMEGSERTQIAHNRFVRNRGGITLGPGSHNVITRNRVVGGDDGIRIEKGEDNLVADNVVADTRVAGIRLGISEPLIGGANNVVRGNLVKDSRVDGFWVNEKDHHSLLKGNTARHSGDDGFDIESSSTKLTGNRASRNADLGIEAVGGVIDTGGNRASGNGDERECVNVKCH